MEKLTRAEEQVMEVCWKTGGGFLKDLVQAFPEPRPAQTTVATLIKILEGKAFVGHEAFGRNFRYFPLVTREEYARVRAQSLLSKYFGGSVSQFVSFFNEKGDLSVEEIEALRKAISDPDTEK